MRKVIVVVGPTATGKSKLGIALALQYDGEIINADSTQIYKGLSVATAKVPLEKREGVIHHLMDVQNVEDDYTVFDFQRDCRKKIEEIFSKGKTPILVGGTGLYIKAALYDYVFDEETPLEDYSTFSSRELYERLKKIDPATTIHPNNRRRVERALSYFHFHKKPFSEKEKSTRLLYDAIFIGLTTEREILYEKINDRVDQMVEDGLLEEAFSIYQSNIRSKAILTPIGYKELFPFFEGTLPLDVCLDTIQKNSRRYAKRQYTWFLRQMDVTWFQADYVCFDHTIEQVCHYLDSRLS